MTDAFGLDLSGTPPAVTVTVWGELDLESAPKLREAIEGVLAGSLETLTLDLSGMSFCDSSCIHVLISISNAAEGAGVDLRVRGPSERSVIDVFKRTGLLSHYNWIAPEPGT
jgi:anti-anti-sigma factor